MALFTRRSRQNIYNQNDATQERTLNVKEVAVLLHLADRTVRKTILDYNRANPFFLTDWIQADTLGYRGGLKWKDF